MADEIDEGMKMLREVEVKWLANQLSTSIADPLDFVAVAERNGLLTTRMAQHTTLNELGAPESTNRFNYFCYVKKSS